MRRLLALTLTALLAAAAATCLPATSAAGGAPAATVTTDKTDYQPGETVVIHGTGWAAGETVQLSIHQESSDRPDTALTSEADEYGVILNKDFSVTEEHRGASFTLTATGAASGRTATAKFTDGGIMSYSPNSISLSSFSGPSSSTSTSFTQTVTAPGGNGNFMAPPVITPVSISGSTPMPPAWVTVSGGGGNFTTGNVNNPSPSSKMRNVTITPVANSAPGLYTVIITSAPANNTVSAGQGTLVSLTVSADTAPPVTTLSAVDSNNNPHNGVNFTNANKVTITLTASDGTGSGVSNTRYKIDNGAFHLYNGPFDIAAEGTSVITYFSIDNLGVQETARFFTVRIDKTKPVITLVGAANITVPYGSTFTDPGATATDTGGSGLAGPVVATGSVNTSVLGDYVISYNVSDNAGNAANTVTRTVHVVKANAFINVTPYSVTFDGSPHTAGGTATGVFGEDLSGLLDLSGTTHTNAGTYNGDAWSFAGNANYNPASGTVDDAIAQAPSSVSINCTPGQVYDGAAHEPCTATATGPGGLNESLTVSYSDNINAGTATASAAYAESGNYLGSSDTENFQIDKAPSVTTVTCGAGPFVYNGAAQTPCSATVTGAGGLNLTPTPAYANNVNAGTATASYTYAGDSNHDGSSDSENFQIDPAPLTITASSPAAVTYGDAAPTVSPGYSGFVPGENSSVLTAQPTCGTTYAAGSDAGVYPTTCSGAADANYQIGYVAGSLTVNKKLLTVTADNKSKIYDGQPYSPFTAQFSGFVLGQNQSVLGGTLTFSTNPSPSVNPGTYTITPGGLASNNYSFNYVNGTLTINPWTLRGFYSPVQMSTGSVVVWNNIKGGQTVPLKFNLYAGTTEKTSTSDVRGFTVTQVPCTAGLDVADDPSGLLNTTGGTAFRYSGTPGLDGQFIQNWATPNTSGKCYKVTMTALDYSTISAFFKTK